MAAFTGEINDGGKVRIGYDIDYEQQGGSVVFTASVTLSARHGYRSGSQWYSSGNNEERMSLSVDGTSSSVKKCADKISSGVAVTREWFQQDASLFDPVSVTVPLKGGAYEITISFTGNGGVSQSYTLMIASPATISISGSGELAAAHSISISKTTPELTVDIGYSCGDASGSVASGTAESNISWTPPLSLAEEVTDSRSVPVTFSVTTYSGAEVIGTSSYSYTFTVPDNESTKPTASVTLSAENGTLISAFAGKYIQGKSKLRTAFTASAKLGASITSYSSTVEGKTAAGNPALSDILSVSGSRSVTAVVTDSRGITRTITGSITVIPYAPPAVIPYTGESSIICARCDSEGALKPSGTYLRIKAGRQYSSVDNINTCNLSYRWRQSGGTYGSWSTLIPPSQSNNFVDVILSGIVTSPAQEYEVQFRAIDDIGESYTQTFAIPTDKIPLHLGNGGRAVAVGKYADTSKQDSFQVAWDTEFEGDVTIRGREFLDWIMPVGAVFTTYNASFDPEEYFGGSWTLIDTTDVYRWRRTA